MNQPMNLPPAAVTAADAGPGTVPWGYDVRALGAARARVLGENDQNGESP